MLIFSLILTLSTKHSQNLFYLYLERNVKNKYSVVEGYAFKLDSFENLLSLPLLPLHTHTHTLYGSFLKRASSHCPVHSQNFTQPHYPVHSHVVVSAHFIITYSLFEKFLIVILETLLENGVAIYIIYFYILVLT